MIYRLCKLCVGGAGVRCTLADPYAGYEGALRCLVANGTGNVAFVRDTTVQHALLSRKILGMFKKQNLITLTYVTSHLYCQKG